MNLRWSQFRFLVMLTALALVAAACGGGSLAESAEDAAADAPSEPAADSADGSEDTAGGGTTDLANYQPLDEAQSVGDDALDPPPDVPDDTLIGVTFPHFRDPYWIAEAWGVQDRADELGLDVQITNAGGYGQTAEQIRHIEDFITQGVDALIVGAVDATGVAPAVNAAWSQGIPVIYANALAESEVSVGVYTNDCAVGELQAEYIAEQDPEAKVVLFTGPPGVSWPARRSDCFKEKIAELAPDAEILTEKFHEMDRAVVLQEMEDTLEAFDEIDFVYNNTDLQAKGVVDALRAAGQQPGDTRVTTLTLGREAFDLMEEGWIEMALAERPVLQGSLAVDMALRILQGEEVPAQWEVEHPLYTNEELAAFEADESVWNWEPEDYQP
jgi:ABC-type sugar transport system substrate-binding protein